MQRYRSKPQARAIDRVSRRLKPEIAVPAATTLLALLIGAGLNSFEARRLERQKFQFDVMKFTLAAAPDPARRLRMLCEFASIGFIDDPDGQYRRTEVGGARPCARPHGGQPFEPSAALEELRQEVGVARDQRGAPSFERGFLKFDGRIGDDRALSDRPVSEAPVRRIVVGWIRSALVDWPDQAIRANGDAAVSQLIVQRDGSVIQAGNLFLGGGVIRIGLVNAGELRFGTESRGLGFQLRDTSGSVVPRDSGIAFHHAGSETIGRQRFPGTQLQAVGRLLAAVCARWPGAVLALTPYLAETVRMQGDEGQLRACRTHAAESGSVQATTVDNAG